MKRNALLGICGLVLGLALGGCGQRQLARGEARVYFELTQADGSVRTSPIRFVRNGEPTVNALAAFKDELARANGSLVFHFDFGPDYAAEMQGSVIAGIFEGNVRIFMISKEQRTLLGEQSYHDGKQDGSSAGYFPDGTVIYEGHWKQGAKDGQWKFNTRLLKPALILSFKEGTFHGESRIYDPSGRTIIQGEYRDGHPFEGTFVDDPWALLNAALLGREQLPATRHYFHEGVETKSEAIVITSVR